MGRATSGSLRLSRRWLSDAAGMGSEAAWLLPTPTRQQSNTEEPVLNTTACYFRNPEPRHADSSSEYRASVSIATLTARIAAASVGYAATSRKVRSGRSSNRWSGRFAASEYSPLWSTESRTQTQQSRASTKCGWQSVGTAVRIGNRRQSRARLLPASPSPSQRRQTTGSSPRPPRFPTPLQDGQVTSQNQSRSEWISDGNRRR